MPESEVKTAYGLFINIDGASEAIIARALMAPAEKTIEVAVTYRGITKEYTLADFFERLGFYAEYCPVCEDTGWVCENHNDKPWKDGDGCGCGGAGEPCSCNREDNFKDGSTTNNAPDIDCPDCHDVEGLCDLHCRPPKDRD